MSHESRPATAWQGVAVSALRHRWQLPALAVFETIGSTNDEAARLAEAGAEAGTVVLADAQQRGRGRKGRPWTAPPGTSILASIVLRPRSGHEDPSVTPIRIGLAAAAVLRDVANIDARVKWPNDIVVPGAGKVGGILCEGTSSGTSSWIVAGIGINVSSTSADFDDDVRPVATSVVMAGGNADAVAILGALLDALRPFEVIGPPLDAATLAGLASLDALAGRTVSVDGAPAGRADGIAPDGSLRIRSAGGTRIVRSGTIRVIGNEAQPEDEAQAEPHTAGAAVRSRAETRQ